MKAGVRNNSGKAKRTRSVSPVKSSRRETDTAARKKISKQASNERQARGSKPIVSEDQQPVERESAIKAGVRNNSGKAKRTRSVSPVKSSRRETDTAARKKISKQASNERQA